MSNYIQIEMKPSKYGDGGALYAKANIKSDNINAPFRNKVVKIDTGCSFNKKSWKKCSI